MAITSLCEEVATTSYRTNIYRVLHMVSPQQWRRLFLSVTVHRSSTYWPVMKVASKGLNCNDGFVAGAASAMPPSLESQISRLVALVKELEDDNYLVFSLFGTEPALRQRR